MVEDCLIYARSWVRSSALKKTEVLVTILQHVSYVPTVTGMKIYTEKGRLLVPWVRCTTWALPTSTYLLLPIPPPIKGVNFFLEQEMLQNSKDSVVHISLIDFLLLVAPSYYSKMIFRKSTYWYCLLLAEARHMEEWRSAIRGQNFCRLVSHLPLTQTKGTCSF